jgi:hypothetical protein
MAMTDYTVTLRFTPEEMARIDKLRGQTNTTNFIHEVVSNTLAEVESYVRLMSNGEPFIEGDEDLTPETLVRMADEGEAGAMDYDDFAKAVWQDFEELKSKHSKGLTQ